MRSSQAEKKTGDPLILVIKLATIAIARLADIEARQASAMLTPPCATAVTARARRSAGRPIFSKRLLQSLHLAH
jgi:hypothetical protein